MIGNPGNAQTFVLLATLLVVGGAVGCGDDAPERGPADRGPGLLGLSLGDPFERADEVVRGATGTPLDRDEENDRYSLRDDLATASRPEVFGHRVVDLAVTTDPATDSVVGLAVLLGDFQSLHGDCDGEAVEAVTAWAAETTGDASPRVLESRLGALREELRRYRGEGFYVDTALLHSTDWCMSLSFQLARADVEGPVDRREAFEAMTRRSAAADGFLSGQHGTFVPDCEAGPIDSARHREMEYTVWSEGELAYLNVGRFARPGEAQLVEANGRETVAVEDGSVTLERYRLLDEGGRSFEIVVGEGRLGFVTPTGRITELLERCPSWRG